MHPMELAGVLKGGARATRRQKETGQRGDDMSDIAAWKAQAAAAGYEHASVIRHDAKSQLLGGAAALLMPIEWEEPFGIVMAEAMACGTPVVGFARGSVPEVVRDGVNGFLCRSPEAAVQAVGRLGEVARATVRRDCEARFGDGVIVGAYERLYREMLHA